MYNTLKEKGCVFRERHGTQTPDWFDLEPTRLTTEQYIALDSTYDWSETSRQWKAVRHECRACHESAVIVNLSAMAKFELKGENATQVVSSLNSRPNNLKTMSNNCTAFTYVVNGRGGIDAELLINRVDSNHFYITCPNVLTNQVMAKINNLIRDEVIANTHLIDCSQAIAILSLNGPQSRQVIENCLNISLDDIEERTHRQINVGVSVPNDRLLYRDVQYKAKAIVILLLHWN